MSVRELEKRITTLPAGQLLKLADWFDGYRTSLGLVPGRVEREDLTPDMIRELERRLQLANDHPERLQAWEGTVAKVRTKLNELRRKKTVQRRTR